MELQATKTSVITVSRTSSLGLSKAIRKIFLKLTEKFIITDIEYAIDYDSDERENIYSAMIMGYLTTGGIIDLSDRDTQFPDGIVLDIQSEEGEPTSAVVGNSLRVATVDNNGLMSKADKQILNQLVLDLTEAKGNITNLEDNITVLQERVTALENKEDKDTVYDDSEVRESLESLRTLLTSVQTASNDSDLEITADITNLKSELETLKSKNISDNESLTSSISRLELAIEQLESTESHLSDITNVINRIESLETEDESVKEILTDLSNSLTNLKNSYTSSTESNQSLIESIQSDIATLKAKPDYDDSEIKGSIESIENTLSNLNNYDDTEIKQTISNLQSVVDTLSQKEDKDTVYDDSEIKGSIESIQATLDSINNQKEANILYNDKEVKESIQALETALSNLSGKETKDISDINELVNGLNSTIESIQTALESDIKENAEAIKLIQEELIGLKNKDTNFTSNIESIQSSIDSLSGNLTSNSEAINSVKNSVSTLEEKVDLNDEEIKGIIVQINESIETLQNKEDKDTVYDDTSIKEAIRNINTAITELENKEDKDTVYDDSELVSRVTTAESDISNLQQSINILTRDKLSNADLYITEDLEEGEESGLDTIQTEIPITDNIKLIDNSLKSIKSRIDILENKEDKDTVYDDLEIKEAISAINSTLEALRNREDKDTVYNDDEIRGLIEILQSSVAVLQGREDKDTVFDDTEIKKSIDAIDLAVKELQAKPDYNDSEIKENISEIEIVLDNLSNDDSSIKSRLSMVENTIKLPNLEEGQDFNYVSKEKTMGGNIKELDSVIKSISDRLAIKEAEEDKDTVYDDSIVQNAIESIQSAIIELQNKEDKDTVYDDKDVRGLIETLQSSVNILENKEDKDTVYDDTAIQTSINSINTVIEELKARPDYDDSEIKSSIESIEKTLSNLNNYDDTSITARVTAIENSIKLPELEEGQNFNYLSKEESVGTNLNILDLTVKALSDRLTIEENKEDKDSVFDDTAINETISSIQSTLETLKNKEDKDTVYNDEEIKGLINTLDASVKVLQETAYDDTAIREIISALQTTVEELQAKPDYDDSEIKEDIESLKDSVSNLNNYDDSNIDSRVTRIENDLKLDETKEYSVIAKTNSTGANLGSIDTSIKSITDRLTIIENKTDKDTVYDDSEIKNKIKNLEDNLVIQEPEQGFDNYKAIDYQASVGENLISLNNFVDNSDRVLNSLITRTGNLEDNIKIPELANGDYDFVDTSKTVGENLAIVDTKISEVNDNLDSKLDSSKLMKDGYFWAEKIRANGNETYIRDEETGGGIFALNKTYKSNQINGIRSYVGVNLGDSSIPLFGQIYAVDLDNGNNGVRVNWNDNRMCYITGNTDSSKIGEERWLPEDREIAVKGDLTDYVPKAKYNALVNLLISKGLVTQEDINVLDS